MCRYHPDKRCFHPSCDFLDGLGMVGICLYHGHVSGRDTPRRVGGSGLSLLQIWALRKRGGVG